MGTFNTSGNGAAHPRIDEKKFDWGPREEAIRNNHFFEVAGSPEMEKIFLQMTKVRPNSNVLLTGESGTGKTNAARVIHALTHDTKAKLVEVAIPALNRELLSSELFGHKKGSFTGATANRGGRFEQANGSSILIDEIGEIPPETQVQLLAALDDPRQITRVGSNDPTHLKLLAMCATTQNLVQLIQQGKFHEPLYRRLTQKIIHLPSLLERGPEHCAHLVRTLLKKIANSGEKERQILDIHPSTLQAITELAYAGNLRELVFLVSDMAERAYDDCETELTDQHLNIALTSRGYTKSEATPLPENEQWHFESTDLRTNYDKLFLKLWALVRHLPTYEAQAAALGINRNTYAKEKERLGINGAEFGITSPPEKP